MSIYELSITFGRSPNSHSIPASSNWHTRFRVTRSEFILSNVADAVSIHDLSIDFPRFRLIYDLSTDIHRFTNSPSYSVTSRHEIFRRRPPDADPQDARYTLFGGTGSLPHHRHSTFHTTSTTSRLSNQRQRHPSTRWYLGPGPGAQLL